MCLCLCALVCIGMCWYVLVCDALCCQCCLRCVVGCVSVGVDALAVVWWVTVQKRKTESVIAKKCPAKDFLALRF